MLNVLVIIPVYNPDYKFNQLLDMLKKQSLKNILVLLIDSGSQKNFSISIKNDSRFIIKEIESSEFNHGRTRQLGMDLYPDKDVYVFLTQDAVLSSERTIENLIKCFDDKTVGCAFGRQLPYRNSTFFSKISRLNNYGEKSYVRSFDERKKYGMKTCFISNSFAAYRNSAMRDVKGFPTNTILCEDVCVAAKMLINGWKIAYDANSQVYHSHNYSIWQEFKRYFDIGVFHSRETWISETFGNAEGEGMKFIKEELKALLRQNPFLIFEMMVRDGMKFIGYRLGKREKKIPIVLKRKISMTRRYWM